MLLSYNKEEIVKREFRDFDFTGLSNSLHLLKKEEYLYVGENVYYGGGNKIWPDEKSMKFLGISKKWREGNKEKPIIAIKLMFRHFFSDKYRYLYVEKENEESDSRIVMWISDRENDFIRLPQKNLQYKDMLPIFDKFLSAMECKWETGVFRSVDLDYIRGKDSLFSFLYCNGYRPLRECYQNLKENGKEEQGFAWAGEFFKESGEKSGCENYLYLALFKKDLEEWDSTAGTDGIYCAWKEVHMELYACRSRGMNYCVCVKGKQFLNLNKIWGAEEFYHYLELFSMLDEEIKKCENTDK